MNKNEIRASVMNAVENSDLKIMGDYYVGKYALVIRNKMYIVKKIVSYSIETASIGNSRGIVKGSKQLIFKDYLGDSYNRYDLAFVGDVLFIEQGSIFSPNQNSFVGIDSIDFDIEEVLLSNGTKLTTPLFDKQGLPDHLYSIPDSQMIEKGLITSAESKKRKSTTYNQMYCLLWASSEVVKIIGARESVNVMYKIERSDGTTHEYPRDYILVEGDVISIEFSDLSKLESLKIVDLYPNVNIKEAVVQFLDGNTEVVTISNFFKNIQELDYVNEVDVASKFGITTNKPSATTGNYIAPIRNMEATTNIKYGDVFYYYSTQHDTPTPRMVTSLTVVPNKVSYFFYRNGGKRETSIDRTTLEKDIANSEVFILRITEESVFFNPEKPDYWIIVGNPKNTKWNYVENFDDGKGNIKQVMTYSSEEQLLQIITERGLAPVDISLVRGMLKNQQPSRIQVKPYDIFWGKNNPKGIQYVKSIINDTVTIVSDAEEYPLPLDNFLNNVESGSWVLHTLSVGDVFEWDSGDNIKEIKNIYQVPDGSGGLYTKISYEAKNIINNTSRPYEIFIGDFIEELQGAGWKLKQNVNTTMPTTISNKINFEVNDIIWIPNEPYKIVRVISIFYGGDLYCEFYDSRGQVQQNIETITKVYREIENGERLKKKLEVGDVFETISGNVKYTITEIEGKGTGRNIVYTTGIANQPYTAKTFEKNFIEDLQSMEMKFVTNNKSATQQTTKQELEIGDLVQNGTTGELIVITNSDNLQLGRGYTAKTFYSKAKPNLIEFSGTQSQLVSDLQNDKIIKIQAGQVFENKNNSYTVQKIWDVNGDPFVEYLESDGFVGDMPLVNFGELLVEYQYRLVAQTTITTTNRINLERNDIIWLKDKPYNIERVLGNKSIYSGNEILSQAYKSSNNSFYEITYDLNLISKNIEDGSMLSAKIEVGNLFESESGYTTYEIKEIKEVGGYINVFYEIGGNGIRNEEISNFISNLQVSSMKLVNPKLVVKPTANSGKLVYCLSQNKNVFTLCNVVGISQLNPDYIESLYYVNEDGKKSEDMRRFMLVEGDTIRITWAFDKKWDFIIQSIKPLNTSNNGEFMLSIKELLSNKVTDLYKSVIEDTSYIKLVEMVNAEQFGVLAQFKPALMPSGLSSSPNKKLAEFFNKNQGDIQNMIDEKNPLASVVTETLNLLNNIFSKTGNLKAQQQEVKNLKKEVEKIEASAEKKIPLITISVEWNTGLPDLKDYTFESWNEFIEELKPVYDNWRKSIIGGYEKVKFNVLWADGSSINDRLDIGDNDFNPYVNTSEDIKKAIVGKESINVMYAIDLKSNINELCFDDADILYSENEMMNLQTKIVEKQMKEEQQESIDIAQQINELEKSLTSATTQQEKDDIQEQIDALNISLNFI